jgi:hypothetical protein
MPQKGENKKDDLKDRMDRPTPHSDTAEGDEETVDESLRQKEDKKRTA